MSACVACNQPTCFDHAMISPANGDVLCHSCVATVQQMAQQHLSDWQRRRDQVEPPPQPSPADGPQCSCEDTLIASQTCPVHGRGSTPHAINMRARHLRTLGLKAGATWREIHVRFRKLGVKYHPDRVKTARAKAAREAKMRAFTGAYHWLRDNEEKAA